jgi:hypothetical protein
MKEQRKTRKPLNQVLESGMDGPLGQSYATELTDSTPKITNVPSQTKRRGAPPATTPGIQHVSGSKHEELELQIRNKDPRMKHRSDQKRKSSRRLTQTPIEEFNKESSNSSPSMDELYDRKMASFENQSNSNSKNREIIPDDGKHNHVNEKGSFDDHEDANLKKPLVTYLEDEFEEDEDGYNSKQHDLNKSSHASVGNENRILVAHGAAGTPDVKLGFIDGGYCGDKFNDENVAIAIAVDDSYYESHSYHFAVEYDPDSKPPLLKNRRFRFYFIMIGLTAFTAILATSIAVPLMMASRNRNAESYPPTESPTTVTDGIYREQFFAAVGPQVLEYGSPHDRAVSWIMNEDPQHLSASSENLIQRYTLALFYFMTTSNEMEPWKSCSRPQGDENESCTFQKFYRAANDSIAFEPENATRWLSGTDECNWVGITCDTSDEGSIVVALEVCKCIYS